MSAEYIIGKSVKSGKYIHIDDVNKVENSQIKKVLFTSFIVKPKSVIIFTINYG